MKGPDHLCLENELNKYINDIKIVFVFSDKKDLLKYEKNTREEKVFTLKISLKKEPF